MSRHTPESKVKKKIRAVLVERNVFYYMPNAGPFGRAGVPDFIICHRGKFIGIEAKADKTKKPTALQTKCMKDIEFAGGKCFVVFDDETLKTVSEYLQCT